MKRLVRIAALLVICGGLPGSCKKKPPPAEPPPSGIFSSPSGTYRIAVRYRYELRHATKTPEASTGSLIATHTNNYDSLCSWTVVRCSPDEIIVRERIARYLVRRRHNDPALEAAYGKKAGTTMPETLRNETLSHWQGYELETDYTSQGVVVARRIVARPPHAIVSSERDLQQYLAVPRSRIPLYPGAPPPVMTAESSWNAGPELVNPVVLIRWPEYSVVPGESWQHGRLKDALMRFDSLERKGEPAVAHISWNWRMTPEQFPDDLAKKMTEHEMKMTTRGCAAWDASNERVLDYASTDTLRHRQTVTRLETQLDVVKISTTTIAIHWTYSRRR